MVTSNNNMLWCAILSVWFVQECLAYTSQEVYCPDLNPQSHISIDQLMGMWYVVEIISHSPDEEYYVRRVPSCPIIHLSEDRESSTTYNPLHRDFNYNYNYGRGYGEYNNDQNYRTTSGRDNYGSGRQDDYYYRNRGGYSNQPYGRSTTYGYNTHYDSSTPPPGYGIESSSGSGRYGDGYYGRRYRDQWRRLRLWWDEDNTSTEYRLRYNLTRAGFWYSSGPDSSVDPQYDHFAGAIQVIKAVGDHLVLTFCHRQPQRKFFTAILSREAYLDRGTIQGVHNLLVRKALSTNNVKKTCGAAGLVSLSIAVLSTVIMIVHGFTKICSCG